MAGEAAAMRFSCDGCGKSYAWKPELAGKKAKCKCGVMISVPAKMGDADDDAGAYDLADSPPVAAVRPAARATAVAAPATAASAGGQALPRATASGRTLNYKSGPTKAQVDRTKNVFFNQTKDVFIPLGMLMFGLLALIVHAIMHEGFSPLAALVVVTVVAGIEVVVLVGIVMAIASKIGVSFGTLWIGILKLATLAVFCAGIDTLVQWAIPGATGWFAGYVAFNACYLGLLIFLFSLDFSEAFFVWVVVGAVRFVLSSFLTVALLAFFVSSFGAGGGGGATAGGGGGGTGISLNKSLAAEQRKAIENLEEANALMEAREFVSKGRQASMKQLIEDVYAAGAKSVQYSVVKQPNTGKIEGADDFIVELPDDATARAKCFEVINAWRKSISVPAADGNPAIIFDPIADDGGPYLFMGVP